MADCVIPCPADKFCDRNVELCLDCASICQPKYLDESLQCPPECKQHATSQGNDVPTSPSSDLLTITIILGVITGICVLTIGAIVVYRRELYPLKLKCSRIFCLKKKKKTVKRGPVAKQNQSLPSLPKSLEQSSEGDSACKRCLTCLSLRRTRSVPDMVQMLKATPQEADLVGTETTTLTTETEIHPRPIDSESRSSRRLFRRSVSESEASERQCLHCDVHADVLPAHFQLPAMSTMPTMPSACITGTQPPVTSEPPVTNEPPVTSTEDPVTQEVTTNGDSSTNQEETWDGDVFLPSIARPNNDFQDRLISVAEENQQRPGPSITRDVPEWMEQPQYSMLDQNRASFLDPDSGSLSYSAPVQLTRSSLGDGGVGFPSWDEPEDVAPSLFTASYNSGSNLAARIEPLRNRHNYIVSCYNHENRVRVGVDSNWSEDQLHTFRREIARDSAIDMHLISMYRQSIAVAQNIAGI